MAVLAKSRTLSRKALERELRIVQGAIAMVASGASPRVSLASLRFAPELTKPARKMALQAGVRVVTPTLSANGVGGLVVERLGDG